MSFGQMSKDGHPDWPQKVISTCLSHAQHNHMEPYHVQLNHMEPSHAELNHIEPSHAQLNHIEPSHVQLDHPKAPLAHRLPNQMRFTA